MSDRKLIYVDASRNTQENQEVVYKIGMYDKSKNVSLGLRLKEDEVKDINDAEKIAILYAFLYIKQKGIENAHILSDNRGVVNKKKIPLLLKHYGISSSWIPREANIIADKLTKLDIAHKNENVNLIHLIDDLIENKIDFSKIIESDEETKIQELTQSNKELKTKNEELSKKVINQRQELAKLKKRKEPTNS